MYAVILAGGVGTRLWPRSRQSAPKQFSDITGDGRTMIQATAARLEGLVARNDIYVVTGSRYASLCAAQLDGLPRANILVEPSGRNTAPAIALACAHLQRRDPAEVVAILPADHHIQDCAAFQEALQQAQRSARSGYLTVLGIEPTKAHTGYGYIQRAARPLPLPGELPTFAVERFLEKPDQATAEQFLADGRFYWNGGIFVSRVDRLLTEYERQMPALFAGMSRIAAALGSPQQESVLAEVWPALPDTSIDYGLMEGAQKVAVTPMQVGVERPGQLGCAGDRHRAGRKRQLSGGGRTPANQQPRQHRRGRQTVGGSDRCRRPYRDRCGRCPADRQKGEHSAGQADCKPDFRPPNAATSCKRSSEPGESRGQRYDRPPQIVDPHPDVGPRRG